MKDKRMPPTIANGQICYFEMPSKDVAGSESFYRKVFEWNIRRQGDGSVAFDDAAGEVSGSWVLGRPPMREVGLLVYIMVDSVAATLEEVLANGGEIVHRSGCPGDYGAVSGSVGASAARRPRPQPRPDQTLILGSATTALSLC